MKREPALVLASGLERMTGSGMSLGQALRVTACQGGQLGREARAVSRDIERGRSLAQSLGRRYGETVIDKARHAVLEAGERAGNPAAALALLKEDLEQGHEERGHMVSTLAYPALLLVMALGVAFLIQALVSPAIRSMYQALSMAEPSSLDRLELACRTLLWGLPLTVVLASLAYRIPSGRSVALGLLTGLPLVGRALVGSAKARAFATAAMLAGAGLGADRALAFGARASGNPMVSAGLERARRRLAKGHDLAEALGASGLPEAERDRALLGLATAEGKAAKGLDELARLCRREADEALAQLTAWAEPALVLLVSAAVCTTALLLYRPLLQSTAALGTALW